KLRKVNYSIHFLTENERIRSRYNSGHDFVLGNCIEIENSASSFNEKHLLMKFQSKNIVFVGRFGNHIKGLDILFQFFLKNKSEISSSGFTFSFYGPESNDKLKLREFSYKNN